jgi:hypothetical protein
LQSGRSTIFSVPPQVFWPYCAAVVSLAVAIAAFWKPAARASGLDRLRALAPAAYAIPLVIFGADHLSSVKEVMRIVPSWMPGKMFWTIFVGAALIFEAMSSVQDRPRELVIRTQEGEDDRVVVTVKDTGIGDVSTGTFIYELESTPYEAWCGMLTRRRHTG